MASGTQKVDANDLEFELSGSEFVAAITPALLADVGFLTKLAASPTFVQALCQSPVFKKCVNALAGTVAGGVVTQGLGR
jgi:hypothetical protein